MELTLEGKGEIIDKHTQWHTKNQRTHTNTQITYISINLTNTL